MNISRKSRNYASNLLKKVSEQSYYYCSYFKITRYTLAKSKLEKGYYKAFIYKYQFYFLWGLTTFFSLIYNP